MKRLIIAVMFAAMAMGANNAHADFIGYYALSNWTTTVSPVGSDASADTTGAPVVLKLTSGDNSIGAPSMVDFTIPAAADGSVSFLWFYNTFDVDGSTEDPFGFLLNGTFTQLTLNGSFLPQGGVVSFGVSTGDSIGFRQIATDSAFGPAVTQIINFTAPASVPEPASLMLLGAGLAGIGIWRRKTAKG